MRAFKFIKSYKVFNFSSFAYKVIVLIAIALLFTRQKLTFAASLPTPLPEPSFTVETFKVNSNGSLSRFKNVNALTIVRYMETDGTLTNPRICYQGNNGGQCPVTNNCMQNGFMSLKIKKAGGSPCNTVKKGYYSTHWKKTVVVDGNTYKLVSPIWYCVAGICTQEELISSGTPYHRGIYKLQ